MGDKELLRVSEGVTDRVGVTLRVTDMDGVTLGVTDMDGVTLGVTEMDGVTLAVSEIVGVMLGVTVAEVERVREADVDREVVRVGEGLGSGTTVHTVRPNASR